MRVVVSTDQGLVANLVEWASGRASHVCHPENLPFVRSRDALGIEGLPALAWLAFVKTELREIALVLPGSSLFTISCVEFYFRNVLLSSGKTVFAATDLPAFAQLPTRMHVL
ncbi:unnamed protein product [Prorocentrum cordatum]|uniref:Uncharacterized protein n=1 Tax=Prorocentrum cordatum TaxID=2364126 RepID=A0ABN9YEI9_9DINO|nr:unnamed protein product [Polarella glacialis]